jgi:hypothetical protein
MSEDCKTLCLLLMLDSAPALPLPVVRLASTGALARSVQARRTLEAQYGLSNLSRTAAAQWLECVDTAAGRDALAQAHASAEAATQHALQQGDALWRNHGQPHAAVCAAMSAGPARDSLVALHLPFLAGPPASPLAAAAHEAAPEPLRGDPEPLQLPPGLVELLQRATGLQRSGCGGSRPQGCSGGRARRCSGARYEGARGSRVQVFECACSSTRLNAVAWPSDAPAAHGGLDACTGCRAGACPAAPGPDWWGLC